MRVGLTGGVGSGKSTVAQLLAGHGAIVIDADAIAREVVEPGTPGLAAVVARFGDRVLGPGGRLDRAALAAIVFHDAGELADLNAIVHPLIGARTTELMDSAPADAILVHDIPLLVEGRLAGGFDTVVVVEAGLQTRLDRLAERGLTPDDARARMASQASDEERRAVADELISNDGTMQALEREVAELWQRLVRRRDEIARGSRGSA
ncbi:dephospho-CoA kinase [Jatrophihabitans cynanchi]|uniref:Dephospho-CoA kinase n=1 Tax=Jatrophihabitans cynanchi TaxID=2944128 RepID=A0ABY7JYX8_9ACTN|nr:dephospho-CoA kinase [Jatrophihabitans sp. SB3-54]WAX57775.1 dephospho-CoA kinase [Jatrophihabitans sp. SB3-54]